MESLLRELTIRKRQLDEVISSTEEILRQASGEMDLPDIFRCSRLIRMVSTSIRRTGIWQ